MSTTRIFSLLYAAILVAIIHANDVDADACNATLQAVPFGGGNATCADGTNPVYYFNQVPGSTKYVVWFGEGAICGTESQCVDEYLSKSPYTEKLCDQDSNDVTSNIFDGATTAEDLGRCYAVKLQHTTSWILPAPSNYTTIKGETILCPNDPHFKDYNLIYVPSCTLDWWLGDGDDAGTASHKLWRGSRVMDALFQALNQLPFSISTASRVVLGGTAGGGIGVINNFVRVREGVLASVQNVMALVDSAFLVNVERFANLSRVYMGADQKSFKLDQDIRNRTGSWIGRAKLDAQCRTTWTGGEASRCVYISEVLKEPAIRDESVMMIQSQYDLAVLSQLDLFNQSLSTLFVDNASYAQNAVSYIEGFGSELRRKMETAAYYQGGGDNQFFLAAACGQYGYLVPTEQQIVSSRDVDLGRAGELQFERDYLVWTTIQVEGMTIREAIVAWVSSEGQSRPILPSTLISASYDPNGVSADRCGTFLCNPTCTNQVIPFALRTIWGPCSQRLVIAYCLIMLGAWWFIFFVAILAVCFFRRRTGKYWDRVISEETETIRRDNGAEQRFHDQAEEELIRDAFASARRVHLMVRNLSYWAPPRKSGRAYQILRDVSATFPAGKVHAMMGPSGSGKSTLLDLIALIRDSGIITGNHYVNGVDSYSKRATFLREWLKHNVSYVRQQDNMFPLLTVREHLTHAAWLMLPEFMDSEQKLRRVWQVIKLMGLEKAADTICGDGGVEVEGGISGGQRRRVSVATQLLKLPACLVLDEPTSGLDATNALALVKSLHTLAHRGGTNIIMTIHQPRREIFRYLDTLKILVGGRILFAGMPKEAFDHFEVSRKLNIGDEVLDQLGKAQLTQIMAFQRKYEKGELGQRVEQEMASEVVLDFDSRLAAQLQYTLTTNALADGRWSWTESSSAPLLMYVLLSRTIKRGGFDVHKTISISLVGGVLVGIVFLGATDTYRRHISMAYLAVATMTFLQGTFMGDRYWAEKFMYTFESEAGATRPWISFLASMFTRLVVAATTEALAFAIPLFYLGRMNNSNHQERTFFLIIVMTAVTTATQYLLVEIYFMKPDDKRTGALFNIGLIAMSALFNGFIIQLKDLPIYLRWVPYIMLAYWAFVAALINDLEGYSITCTASVLECSARTGDAIVKGLQYDDRDIFQCLFVLLVLTGIFLLASVIVFFYKWVSPIGSGLKRRTNADLRAEDEKFFERARELAKQEGTQQNTMQAVLKEGKNLQKQGSNGTLKRGDSTGTMKRGDSAGSMTRFDSNGSLTRNDSGGSLVGELDRPKVVLNPAIEREDSSKTVNSNGEPIAPPPGLVTENSFQNTLLEVTDGDDDGDAPTVQEGCCQAEGGIAAPFLSRILLVCYYIVDFLAAATICNGQEDAIVEGFEDTSDALNNVTSILGNLGGGLSSVSADSINVVFVLVTAVFLIGYVIQFIIQFVMLFPRDINNRINPCTRVALLDILGAGFIAIDFILLFILLGAGKGAQLQIYLLLAIRIVRGLRVLTFWYKISAFHELRVIAYLEYKLMLMGEYDPSAYGENEGNDLGDKDGDKKPPIPDRLTKPSINVMLLSARGVQTPSMRYEETVSVSDRSVTGGAGGFIRKAIQSIRGPSISTEQRRISLQQRVSLVNKRLSSRISGAKLEDPALSPQIGSPPIPPTPPVPPPVPAFATRPPPIAPRPPVLPPIMRVNMPSLPPPPGTEPPGNSRGRISMRNPFAAPPPVPPPPPEGFRRKTFGNGVPPPIAPRTNMSISGFGIAPGAMQLMQGQRPMHQGNFRARKDEPAMDEV